MTDSDKTSDRPLELVAAALQRAASQVWFDIDHPAGATGEAYRLVLALGLDLAHAQAIAVPDEDVDRRQPWTGDQLVEGAAPLGVTACLDLAVSEMDATCETGPWRLSTAQLQVAVVDLTHEARRAVTDPDGFHPSWDPGQPPLFDADLAAPARDTRSVGELLSDIDRQARDLLFEVRAEHAGPLIRGWPALVQAAWDLWEVIPGRPTDTYGRQLTDRPLQRTLALGDAVTAATERRVWPGSGPADHRMVDWSASLERAAQLVRRYGAEIPFEKPAAHNDIKNARVRVLHGLYVANHATILAVRERARELGRDPSTTIRPPSRILNLDRNLISNAEHWITRLGATERTLSVHLSAQPAARAPASRQIGDADDPGSIERTLTRWDIQAHRTLAHDPSPSNVYLICRAQVLVAGMAAATLEGSSNPAAERADSEDRPTLQAATSQRAWSLLAERWHDLVLPRHRLDPPIAVAAGELRTAAATLLDITSSADRSLPHLYEHVLGQALHAAAEVAEVVRDLSYDSTLVGLANVVSRRAHDDAEREVDLGERPDVDTIWVPPRTGMSRGTVPLPEPVAISLRAIAGSNVGTARRAAAQVDDWVGAEAVPEHSRARRPSPEQQRGDPGVDAVGR